MATRTNDRTVAERASPRARRASVRLGRSDKAPRQGFVLRTVEGPRSGQEYAFESEATIGRIEQSDLPLVEPGVSRQHARISNAHGVYMLEDLGSANGTRLNGEKIEHPEVLREGDHITLGQSTFRFGLLQVLRGEPTAQVRLTESKLHQFDVSHTHPVGSARRWAKLRVIALVGVGGALLGLMAYLLLHSDRPLVRRDRSAVAVMYADDDAFFRRTFGYGEYDREHADELNIDFRYSGGRVTLQYGARGIDKVGEVSITLNGKKVGEVPLTLDRWSYGLWLVLPPELLRAGQLNRLVFDNLRNPPRRDSWEVRYVQLLQEVIPPADRRQAEERHGMARKLWDARFVDPQNMYHALVGFRRARDLLEGLPEAQRPALYLELTELIAQANEELTKRFQEGLFSAERALKVDRDPRAARMALMQTQRYFGKEDFRFRELARFLETLSAAGAGH